MRDVKPRISGRLRRAIRLMVEEGMKRSAAAEASGLKDNSLYVALRRPEICVYRNELLRVLRESEASRSIQRVAVLADDAESEHVRLGANTLLLGIEGISAISRVEGRIEHTGVAGLVVNFIEREPSPLIEGTATVIPPRRVNSLRPPVPHPLDRKRETG